MLDELASDPQIQGGAIAGVGVLWSHESDAVITTDLLAQPDRIETSGGSRTWLTDLLFASVGCGQLAVAAGRNRRRLSKPRNASYLR